MTSEMTPEMAAEITAAPERRFGRLNLALVGLTLLAGVSMSMGFIQLLAEPLETLSNLSVQVLSLQATVLCTPLVISLLLVMREGPELVLCGHRLTRQTNLSTWRLWREHAPLLLVTALVLVPYLLAAALVGAALTKPQINGLQELQVLVGTLNPPILLGALFKTPIFAGLIAWIMLQQGAMAQRYNVPTTVALSRAICISIAIVLALNLSLALLFNPSLNGGNL